MTQLVIDTHVWVWFAQNHERLTRHARQTIEKTKTVFVPSVSVYEIGQKVSRGRWAGLNRAAFEQLLSTLPGGLKIIDLSPSIARAAALLDWPHRDPFDRIIAATALEFECPLVSRDPIFDDVSGLARVWDNSDA